MLDGKYFSYMELNVIISWFKKNQNWDKLIELSGFACLWLLQHRLSIVLEH